ncbi:hypothetical protein J6590_036510 [Homalodisca vitripennis]|nr:hypothetical protein J6590_036510 [Homalodisca vitripennis]
MISFTLPSYSAIPSSTSSLQRLLSARRASQIAVFDNEIERWGEVDVPYLLSQLIGSYNNE